MLLTGLSSSFASLNDWVEVSGAGLSGTVIVLRPHAQLTGTPTIVACTTPHLQSTQLVSCLSTKLSSETFCNQWAEWNEVEGCSLSATLDHTGQMVTLHNQEEHSVKWNAIFDIENNGISLSNLPVKDVPDNVVSERFELPPSKSVSFPFALFGSTSSNMLSYKSEMVQRLRSCQRLHHWWNEMQLFAQPTFLLQSDNTHMHFESSLSHQLELCSIHAPTVHMYHSDNDYLFVNTSLNNSRCTVQHVTHLTPVSVYANNDGTTRALTNVGGTATVPAFTPTHETGTFVHSPIGPVTPVCMEDVMYHLLYHTTTDNNITSSQSLNFVSSIGFHDVAFNTNNVKSTSTAERSLAGFRDLLAVLRAYSTADVTAPLVIHTIHPKRTSYINYSIELYSIVPDMKVTRALSRHLLSMLLIFNTDASPAVAFETALSQLSTTLTLLLNTNTGTTVESDNANNQLPSWCPARAALLDLLILHFGEESSKFAHTCRSQLGGTAPMTYLCAIKAAREKLGDVILSHIAVGKVEGTTHTSVVDQHIANTIHQLVNGTPTMPPATSKATPQPISVLVSGDLFVFLFVRPEQVSYAQQLVYHWQRHGADTTNFIFIKYLIFPIHSPTKSNSNTITDIPSLHAVLSILETKIQQLTSVKDVVYVLIGLKAALAFPQPGRLLGPQEDELLALCKNHTVRRDITCDANTVRVLPHERHLVDNNECNLCTATAYTTTDPCAFVLETVPSVPYGWSKNMRLSAKITISATRSTHINNARSGDNINNQADVLPWDFTAMVGIGYKLLDMIRAVTSVDGDSDGAYELQTTYTLQQRLQAYALTNPFDVTLDCSQQTFHTSKTSLLYQMVQIQQQKGSVSYHDLPILREVLHRPVGNDTIYAMANALKIVLVDEHGSALNSVEPSDTISLKEKEETMYDNRIAYSYRQFRRAANTLMSAYLDDTDDYYDLRQVAQGRIEHADVILPLIKWDELPIPRNYLNTTVVPSDPKYKCYIDPVGYAAVQDHIFKVLHLNNHITSTIMSIINLIHQVVVCECNDTKYNMDEAVYHFVRIGLLGKYVTHHLPEGEYKVTAALLENYETFLLSIFTPDIKSRHSDEYRNECGIYNSKYSQTYYSSSDTNTLYGNLLDNTNVFTPEVIALYKNLSTYYKNQLLVTVRYALTGVRIEHSIFPAVTHSLQRSFQVQTFQEVNKTRTEWQLQKAKLAQSLLQGQVDVGSAAVNNLSTTHANTTNKMNINGIEEVAAVPVPVPPIVRVHYVTYGSDLTEGLQNLLDSAKMSGITIEVLGLNTHYEDYSSKTDAYLNYLHNSSGPHTRASSNGSTFEAVPDDDVVMFMDAYDVLVLPAIVKTASVLAKSPTPIVFCAERGVYPEMPGPIFYPRGVKNPHRSTYPSPADPTADLGYSADGSESSVESSAYSLKMLNSGCVVGRAGQLKHMMAYAHYYSRVYRDDQLAMVRYHIEHPGAVSLDTNSALFATSFKLASVPQEIQLAYDLRLYQGHRNIGLLHCNNHKSNGVYGAISFNIKHALDKYYHGEEGELLQRAIQLYSAGHIERAIQMLHHPVLLKNCTSLGGTNPIRYFVLQRIRMESS